MAQLYRTLTSQSSASRENALGATLSKVGTTGSTAGVLNHLTDVQAQRLDEFKQRLQKEGWWSPDGINGKPTHDDGTLLRYLRARKFDVNGAYGQFTDTEKWMKEQHVESLYEHFDVEFYERARVMYPQWTGRRDRRGIPIYVYEIKGLDSKNVHEYQKQSNEYKKHSPKHKNLTTPAQLLPLFALYHNLLNFVLPMCSTLERPRPETPVTNSTNIVDISGVSLRQFWNLKNHMQDASVLATAHYPETLDRIFIIGAPAFFPTVWGWIKRWFDPVTVSKIFILNRNEVKPVLDKFMEPSSVPKKYGGTLEWSWGDLPALDDETREAVEKDGNKGWVRGPTLWLDHARVVVGSVNGTLRRSDKEIAEMKPVIYAADNTEEPVHPEKRASVITDGGTKTDNGSISAKPIPPTETGVTTTATATAVAAGTTDTLSHASPTEPPKTPVPPTDLENVRRSPMGDSQVHIPSNQAAPPSSTVEYLNKPPADVVSAPSATHVESPTAAAPISGAGIAVPNSAPPGHIQPGPLPEHAVELNKKIASQLQGESTVTIPAQANGTLAHPEIIKTSDGAKGLAMETEKLEINGKATSEAERPGVERFVTAAEF